MCRQNNNFSFTRGQNFFEIGHLGRLSPLQQKWKSLVFLKSVDIAANPQPVDILYMQIRFSNKYETVHQTPSKHKIETLTP